ncbi:MAG: quinone oxidoreductase family protein [Cyclobacteriaceae bacterium]
MQAILIENTGGSSNLQYKEVPDPSPKENEALVKNHAIGINFIDVYHRTGLYPKEVPFIPGLEGSGVIVKTGNNVSNAHVGMKVAYNGVPGAYAEFTAVPEEKLVPIPEDLDFHLAAAVMLQGMTAHYLHKSTYPLGQGDTCLIHAAAGGVGLLLVQMAKIAGARVIGTVSTEEKARMALNAGADEIIRYTELDFVTEVIRITEGKKCNVVYDSVGKDTFYKSLDCLAPLGYLVLFGQSSGKVEPFDPAILNQKGSLFLTRPTLFHYVSSRIQLQQRADDIFKWITNKQLQVRIDRKLPLAEAKKAHDLLEQRKTMGKLILVP